MSTVEILILGLALSMDAFAVTISNTFAYRNLTRAREAWMPLAFGIFQGIMPLIGYLLGERATIVGGIVLILIGVKSLIM